jgi:hypothetical protein
MSGNENDVQKQAQYQSEMTEATSAIDGLIHELENSEVSDQRILAKYIKVEYKPRIQAEKQAYAEQAVKTALEAVLRRARYVCQGQDYVTYRELKVIADNLLSESSREANKK